MGIDEINTQSRDLSVKECPYSGSTDGSIASQRFYSDITEVFRARIPLRNSIAELCAHDIQISGGPTLDLLENGMEIVATNRGRTRLYTSSDAGISWTRRHESTDFSSSISQCFTLADGSRIVRTQNPARILMFDCQGNLMGDKTAGLYPWHGSQGIGQSSSGTVMYAEYPPFQHEGEIPIAVWRYKLGQNEWEKVFEVMAAEKPPLGDVRHFHVCTPSMENPGLWLLASGDNTRHNRLWLSDDDGDHWREIVVDESPSPRIKRANRQRILRFTSFISNSDGSFVWGTDDDLGVGTSALVKMSLRDGKAEFSIISWLGPNYTRNIVSLGEDLIMTVSESKRDPQHVELWFGDLLNGLATAVRVPNLAGAPSSISDSICGRRFIDGVVFIPASGSLFTTNKCGVLRVSLKRLS